MPYCSVLTKSTGINPRVWGPLMWRLMHAIAWGWEKRRTTMISKQELHYWAKIHVLFFNSLTCLLPCKKCCTHYAEIIRKNRLTVVNVLKPLGLPLWLYQVHLESRKKHDKSSPAFSVVSQRYKGSAPNEHIWTTDGCHMAMFVACDAPLKFSKKSDMLAYKNFYQHLALLSPLSYQRDMLSCVAMHIKKDMTRKALVEGVVRKIATWSLFKYGNTMQLLSMLPHWRKHVSSGAKSPICEYITGLKK